MRETFITLESLFMVVWQTKIKCTSENLKFDCCNLPIATIEFNRFVTEHAHSKLTVENLLAFLGLKAYMYKLQCVVQTEVSL